MKKSFIFALFLVLLILISGCKGKKSVEKSLEEIRTGTEGIVLNFLPNAPPDKIHVETGSNLDLNTFDVVLELRNKGAYPQPGEGVIEGSVLLSGYDINILGVLGNILPGESLSAKSLEGRSTINPNGGLDLVSLKVGVIADNLNVEKYEPTLQATVCYKYQTVAGPLVCIDPIPYSTVNERKVCQVNDLTLSSQGAPIAVTKIDEEAFATKTQFKITIKNVGGGDVLNSNSISKCSPAQDRITRDDVDRVTLAEAKVGTKTLQCGPFINTLGGTRSTTGEIRLINGEGFIICELYSNVYSNTKTPYQSPLQIKLTYGYRSSIEKKIQIKKEISGSETGGGVPSQPPYNPEGEPNRPGEPAPIFPEGIKYT